MTDKKILRLEYIIEKQAEALNNLTKYLLMDQEFLKNVQIVNAGETKFSNIPIPNFDEQTSKEEIPKTENIRNLSVENEIESMFDEESKIRDRSLEETLDVGKQIGEEPVRYFAKRGGGYATNEEIKESKDDSDLFKEKNLSRADELDIIHTFGNIKGMGYHQACGFVEERGYTLHPLYVNNGDKRKALTYKGTCLGIKIKDPDFDYFKYELSKKAIIVDIVDVGGQDKDNRGMIKI